VYKRGTFIANHLLLEKWKEHIRISDSRILWQVNVIVEKLGFSSFTLQIGRDYPVGFPELPAREYEFLVPLTDSEVMSAEAQLTAMPVSLDSGFVTLTVRDAAYKRKHRITPLQSDVKEAYRNNNIEDFMVLCGEARRAGLSLIRMGQTVEQKFDSEDQSCFDYASSGLRTELLDHYLMTHCQLCVTTSLGFDAIPGMAGIPRLVVNVVPYFVLSDHYAWDVVVPVRFSDSSAGRELTLSETLERRSIRAFRGSEELAKDGLTIIHMTSIELAEAFRDSLSFQVGKEALTRDDQELQASFWNTLAGTIPIGHRPLDARPLVAPSYLRRHQQWLLK
jgi:putative glycosyltransferase (TIGR04372 family)